LYEIAKELGKESKEVVARAKELGLEVKSHSSSVEEEASQRIKASFATKEVAKPLPEKEILWTIFVLSLVLLFGTIDFSVRKPEPKVEIHKLSQELYRGFEYERNSSCSDLKKC